jgi:hypothetical protein
MVQVTGSRQWQLIYPNWSNQGPKKSYRPGPWGADALVVTVRQWATGSAVLARVVLAEVALGKDPRVDVA